MGFSRQEYWSGVPLPSLLFFCDLYNSHVGVFDVVPEVSETILSSFHSFYFVVQCLRHLMGQPLYCLAANAGVWRAERL